ncbi:probable cytochrome P450 CYP44 isoform X1 [Schistocerca cancellata]|uniref:probable cytochrome P450 CYP44 isoform X1 n=2 Tax=Schistocerca cancellata TaxID=274614 RepID=UPI0021174E79|nr:probable cytochrome P450 CYP44 isoform X1 [Schistocerca cancellata]
MSAFHQSAGHIKDVMATVGQKYLLFQRHLKSSKHCFGMHLYLRSAHKGAKPFHDIPGPVRLPLWGNLLHYKLGAFDGRKYHEVLERLHEQYGPIVRETIGSRTVVHVFDPDDIKEVYANEGHTPFVAPLMETAQLYRKQKNISLGLGNVNGEEWYRLRSSVRHLMLRPKEVHVYFPAVQEIAKDFVSHLENILLVDGKVENLRDEVSKWVQESAGAICFGRRLGCLYGGEMEKVAQKIIDANKEVFQLSAILKFSLPMYKYFRTPKWKRITEAENFIYRTTEKYVEETINKVKTLLEMENRVEEKYQFIMQLLSKDTLSRDDVIIVTFSLFTDGLSTTVPALLYNLYCLATNPEVQDKAYREIESVLKETDEITVDVLNKLPYIKAIVKETFRFYPIGTEVSRIIQKDLILSGYHVPKGTHVDLTPNVHFLSEKYFKDARIYLPDRWLRGNENTSYHPYLLTPFGHGTRTCAGRRFAEQDLYLILFYILQKFKLEYQSSTKRLEQVFETLLFPDGSVDVIFKPRSNYA